MCKTACIRRILVVFLWTAVSLIGTAAYAQYRASLQGAVTDAQGGILPGATVTLIDKETNRTLTTVTNESGVYVFNALAPRPYTLEVELAGFRKAVLQDVRILPEQANTVDVKLEIGGAIGPEPHPNCIEVSCEAALC
jgi:Carboxypeptidase regulatory-like domain